MFLKSLFVCFCELFLIDYKKKKLNDVGVCMSCWWWIWAMAFYQIVFFSANLFVDYWEKNIRFLVSGFAYKIEWYWKKENLKCEDKRKRKRKNMNKHQWKCFIQILFWYVYRKRIQIWCMYFFKELGVHYRLCSGVYQIYPIRKKNFQKHSVYSVWRGWHIFFDTHTIQYNWESSRKERKQKMLTIDNFRIGWQLWWWITFLFSSVFVSIKKAKNKVSKVIVFCVYGMNTFLFIYTVRFVSERKNVIVLLFVSNNIHQFFFVCW